MPMVSATTRDPRPTVKTARRAVVHRLGKHAKSECQTPDLGSPHGRWMARHHRSHGVPVGVDRARPASGRRVVRRRSVGARRRRARQLPHRHRASRGMGARRAIPGARGRGQSRCKHPSCGVRSANADADHLPAFVDGGRTSAAGMSPTCPRHNRGRQASGWAVHDEGPRDPHGPPDPVWTSPLGRFYQTHVSRALTLDHIPLRT